jgi:hypothetical protein
MLSGLSIKPVVLFKRAFGAILEHTMKSRPRFAKILIILACVIAAVLAAIALLYRNELRSLSSLQKLDPYPLYRMTYYGDYGFDEFLKTGASSDSDIERFVAKRLLHGLSVSFGVTGVGCTAFTAANEKGERLLCRNFDFRYTPSLQLFTRPDGGYASVSTVNLSYAGYTAKRLPEPGRLSSFLVLAAPFLPFDGVNEKGVAMALLAVPQVQPPHDEGKVTLNTTTAIRLVLDKAANVDEAIALLSKYNIYFSGGVDCHYLIADASGKSAIVEYWEGKLQVVRPAGPYQVASNFVAYKGLDIGDGFERYDKANASLGPTGGVISEDVAMGLLADLGCYSDKGEDRLQWSVVYRLTAPGGLVAVHRKNGSPFEFVLPSRRK